MKTVRDALILAWLKSYPDLRRQPLLIFLIIMISALPLVFFAVLGSGNIFSYGIVGALVGTLAFLALNGPIQEIGFDRYVKMREMMVAMPVQPIAYSTGVALSALIVSLPAVLFYLVLAGIYNLLSLNSILWIALALIFAWISASTLSFAISSYLTKSTAQTLNSVANLLGIGLVFLPPVYYPDARLAGLSWIAALIPTSNAASLIRFYTGLSTLTTGDLILRWILLLLMTFLFVAIAATKSRWRER